MRWLGLYLPFYHLLGFVLVFERAIGPDITHQALHHRLNTLLDLIEWVGREARALGKTGVRLILDRLLLFLDEVLFGHLFIDVFQETVFQSIRHLVHNVLHLCL